MSEDQSHPLALTAMEVEPRPRKSLYPEQLARRVAGREKRILGDKFGLSNFGVNLTRLEPGAESALMHRHARQDEFIYVLSGRAILKTDRGDTELKAGDCAGFPAGGLAHHLVNPFAEDMVYLEIGDRTAGDAVEYPDDDLAADFVDGQWVMTRKDGSPF